MEHRLYSFMPQATPVTCGDGQSQLPWLPVAPPTANHSNSTAHAAPPNPRRVRAQSVAGGYQKQQSEQEQQYHQQQQGQPEQHTVIRRQHSTGSAPLDLPPPTVTTTTTTSCSSPLTQHSQHTRPPTALRASYSGLSPTGPVTRPSLPPFSPDVEPPAKPATRGAGPTPSSPRRSLVGSSMSAAEGGPLPWYARAFHSTGGSAAPGCSYDGVPSAATHSAAGGCGSSGVLPRVSGDVPLLPLLQSSQQAQGGTVAAAASAGGGEDSPAISRHSARRHSVSGSIVASGRSFLNAGESPRGPGLGSGAASGAGQPSPVRQSFTGQLALAPLSPVPGATAAVAAVGGAPVPARGAASGRTACTASTALHEAKEAMQGAAGELLALYEAVVAQSARTGPAGEGHSGAIGGAASVLTAGSPLQEQSGLGQPEGGSARMPPLPHGPLAQLRAAGPELHADLRGCMQRAFQALQQQLREQQQQQQQQAQVRVGAPVGTGGAVAFLGTASESPDVQQGGGRLVSCVHECWATLDAVLEGSAELTAALLREVLDIREAAAATAVRTGARPTPPPATPGHAPAASFRHSQSCGQLEGDDYGSTGEWGRHGVGPSTFPGCEGAARPPGAGQLEQAPAALHQELEELRAANIVLQRQLHHCNAQLAAVHAACAPAHPRSADAAPARPSSASAFTSSPGGAQPPASIAPAATPPYSLGIGPGPRPPSAGAGAGASVCSPRSSRHHNSTPAPCGLAPARPGTAGGAAGAHSGGVGAWMTRQEGTGAARQRTSGPGCGGGQQRRTSAAGGGALLAAAAGELPGAGGGGGGGGGAASVHAVAGEAAGGGGEGVDACSGRLFCRVAFDRGRSSRGGGEQAGGSGGAGGAVEMREEGSGAAARGVQRPGGSRRGSSSSGCGAGGGAGQAVGDVLVEDLNGLEVVAGAMGWRGPPEVQRQALGSASFAEWVPSSGARRW